MLLKSLYLNEAGLKKKNLKIGLPASLKQMLLQHVSELNYT